MHARNPFTITKNVECALAHAGHDAHVHGDIGRVAELHTYVCDRRTKRTHREGHDVHRATLHGAGIELVHLGTHLCGRTPVVCGARIDFAFGADVGAVFNASNIARVGECEVTVRTLCFVQRAERSAFNELRAQTLVLFSRAVAPIDVVGLQDFAPLFDPVDQLLVFCLPGHSSSDIVVECALRLSGGLFSGSGCRRVNLW